LTSMGFYGTTNYDSGLPKKPQQTALENTRATRPLHIGAPETLDRWRIAPVHIASTRSEKDNNPELSFSIKKIKATGGRLQAAGSRQQAVTDL